jgi:hypothetical protein
MTSRLTIESFINDVWEAWSRTVPFLNELGLRSA